MESLSKQYYAYVERLENIVYENIAIKLATFKGFDESLKLSLKNTVRDFPLLYFIVESLQIDCVLTISKLTEKNKGGKTFVEFFNFASSNIKAISKVYPKLTPAVIDANNKSLIEVSQQIERIKKQRDKYYAHSDNEYFLEHNKLLIDFPETYKDMVDIIIELQNIISSHRLIIKGNRIICMSDFAYLNTFKTMELLKEANDEWYKNYRAH
ncbi:MAG: hypothetical protein PSX36_14145 [bacterium]|nr:hypothetical protein [bacterium]